MIYSLIFSPFMNFPSVLRRAFDTLDSGKKGNISVDDLGTILDTLGQHQNDAALKDLVASVDRDGNHCFKHLLSTNYFTLNNFFIC